MRTESLREVKNNFSRVIDTLPESGPVLITRNGKGAALLIGLDEKTDPEALLLSANRGFWERFDRATRSRRWTSLAKLP